MIFSENSQKIIDSCRFCWMCHHICPVGNATGQERNTARARAIALSLYTRGAVEMNDGVIDNIYECTLCGGCTECCVTGWDPTVFIKEARTKLALEGQTPSYAMKLVKNFAKSGNIYGAKSVDKKLAAEIAAVKANPDTLLFLGADARYKVGKDGIAAIAAMKKCGEKFTVLDKEPDCGTGLDTLIGAVAETQSAMKECAKVLNGYKTVVVLDPADALTIIRTYKEYGISVKAKVVTFTAFAAAALKAGKLKLKKGKDTLTYHDPWQLSRQLDETAPARKIIAGVGKLEEIFLNKRETFGMGNLIMNEWMSDAIALMGKERADAALRTGAQTVVVAAPSDYAIMKAALPKNVDVLTVAMLIAEN